MYPVSVSDHAIVRFLERVYGINMDEVREKIISIEEFERYKHLENFKIRRENYVVVVNDNVVATVLDKEMDRRFINKREYEKNLGKNRKKKTKGQ